MLYIHTENLRNICIEYAPIKSDYHTWFQFGEIGNENPNNMQAIGFNNLFSYTCFAIGAYPMLKTVFSPHVCTL
mgnify:CR=1 FL=1